MKAKEENIPEEKNTKNKLGLTYCVCSWNGDIVKIVTFKVITPKKEN